MLKSQEINVVKFNWCANHFFHKECVEAGFKGEYLKCPVCFLIYGEFIGDMPTGTLSWEKSSEYECEGYEDIDTWILNYDFANGVWNGVPYRGTGRTAYLPDNTEGREVLCLLIKCFWRQHTFTVGTSVTTGRSNVVVWNSIHHKTSPNGGVLSYGYPDPTYLNRVKLELADKGIVIEEGDKPDEISDSGTIHVVNKNDKNE